MVYVPEDQRRKYIVERRDADGNLDFRGKQPPFIEATERQLFDYYFRHHPHKQSASQEEIREWYAAQGWSYRPKTW